MTKPYFEAIDPRAEILKDFDTTPEGTISSPGKFEGEPLFVPYFYDFWMHGYADETYYDDMETEIAVFKVTETDLDHFMDLGIDTVAVVLVENELGFVFHETLNPAELERLREKYENTDDEAPALRCPNCHRTDSFQIVSTIKAHFSVTNTLHLLHVEPDLEAAAIEYDPDDMHDNDNLTTYCEICSYDGPLKEFKTENQNDH